MKTSLNWLTEYVDIKGLKPQEISDGLRFSGTENVLLAGPELDSHIVVGEIKEIVKHPNADKLQIAQVAISEKNSSIQNSKPKTQNSDGEYLTIVCGAPNIKVGQKVPVALVGTKFEDFEIKKAKIRDVESSGMLCSEKELGLGDDHSGIMILDKVAKVGQKFSDHLGGGSTSTIDAELTPNRGDCLSMIGMAREVAATFGRKFKMPKIEIPTIKSQKTIEVEVIDKNLCPRYIAKVVENVKIGPSPKWMQERLTAAGVRPISNVVDVTNYVMLELGQPMHAFDLDKLESMKISNAKHQIPNKSQATKKIIVRKAKAGDRLVTLDGQDRKLTADDLLICDAKKPVALAGVMGGLNSEVDENTTSIVLEAAVFNPATVRKTAQRLNLRSEASNRFEKGIPLALPEVAIERAAELLIANSQKPKAVTVGPSTDVLSSWIWVQRVGLAHSRVKGLLGIDVEESKIIDILKSLGFEVEKFDFKAEARKHVNKPYVFGASYKTHGDMAFDCSYLTDYIYSKIGKFIGYASLAQFEIGRPVDEAELQPGDILFIKGHIDKSATDHYFRPDGKGGYEKVTLKNPKEVGHNALYIGNGRIIHARHFEYDNKNKKWKKLPNGKVVEENVEVFTESPEYLGARRYIESPGEYLAITVPWWRLDIRIEEDILEEIARVYGYDKIPPTLPAGPLPGVVQNKQVVMESKIKQKLVAQGLTEVITYSFVSEKLVKISGAEISSLPKINNPLSLDQEYMRGALWPSLVEVVAKNQDYSDSLRIFEIANVYSKKSLDPQLHFSAVVKVGSGKSAFYDLKGMLWSVLREFDLDSIETKPAEVIFSAKGQGAEIKVGGRAIGQIGILDRKIASKLGHKTDLAIAEIDLSGIIGAFGRKISYQTLPKYPRAKRDISVVLSREIFVSEIVKILASVNSDYLLGYKVADVYEGKGLSENKKSVTISLEMGSDTRTLTEEEIENSVSLMVEALSKIGGELRR